MKTCILFTDYLFNEYTINNFNKLKKESNLPCFYLLSNIDNKNKKINRNLNNIEESLIKDLINIDIEILQKDNIFFFENNKSILWESQHMAAYYFSQYHKYDFYWTIDYDVFFDGNWKDFFDFFLDKKEDFLSCVFEKPTKHYMEELNFKLSFEVPESKQERCWCPFNRYSSRLMQKIDEYNKNKKFGSTELLIPQICNLENLTKKDINGFDKLFVRSTEKTTLCAKFYENSTFNWKVKKLKEIELKNDNILYHPVKSY